MKELNKNIQDLNGNRNSKEIKKGSNSGDGKPRKEIRSYRYKHQQQNTRYRRQNLRHRRSIEDIKKKKNSQRKYKVQKAPKTSRKLRTQSKDQT
jgi:hypothetical protein